MARERDHLPADAEQRRELPEGGRVLDDLRGAIDILRKRRAKGLLLPATHPAHGLPFGNDEADLWHRTTELPDGQRTEMPFLSIGSEMYRGFLEFGKALCVLGERYSHPDAIAEGRKMQQEAAALLEDVKTALERTIAIAAGTPGPCPFSFVAGGDSCTVADATQSRALQSRESEPWRTYSELMYSSVLNRTQVLSYLDYAEQNDQSMKPRLYQSVKYSSFSPGSTSTRYSPSPPPISMPRLIVSIKHMVSVRQTSASPTSPL